MRPNILFYFTDQQRADTCGCYGQPLAVTPRLDQLAARGTQFRWAFSPQPVCGPCRAILQTGLWPTQTGCFRNDVMLPPDVPTLAQHLQAAGYECGYAGKWHLASGIDPAAGAYVDHRTAPIPPAYRGGYSGFWRAADVLEFTSGAFGGHVYDEAMHKRSFKGYRADRITDFALEFFDERDRAKPFFLMISHIEPHHQNDAGHSIGPEGSQERFKDYVLPGDLKASPGTARAEYPDYLGACRSLDDNLGRVLDRLEGEGLLDSTVVIFASDHGSHFGSRNRDAHLHGADDYKRSCHDASLRVPLVIAGGPFSGGGVVEQLVSTLSLPRTILALAGAGGGEAMAGEDLATLLGDPPAERANEVFAQISESRVGRCLRTPDYTYAVYAPGLEGSTHAASPVYADDFLYDLRKDPHQLNNLAADPDYTVIKEELRVRLLRHIQQAEGAEPVIEDA